MSTERDYERDYADLLRAAQRVVQAAHADVDSEQLRDEIFGGLERVIYDQQPIREYVVEWVVDVQAKSPREAAEVALGHQRNRASLATVFDVREQGSEHGTRIDLAVEEAPAPVLSFECPRCHSRYATESELKHHRDAMKKAGIFSH